MVPDLARWMVDRRPGAPRQLAERLGAEVDGAAPSDGEGEGRGTWTPVLSELARLRLDDARARPGRVRDSAFDLLVADALLTYACESALDAEDPDAALLELFAIGVGR